MSAQQEYEHIGDVIQPPNAATQAFIAQHLHESVTDVALHSKVSAADGTPEQLVDMRYALQHIDAWQRAQHKLPQWAATDGVMFPAKISMEQCSSEDTARYKAQLVQQWLQRLQRSPQWHVQQGEEYAQQEKQCDQHEENCAQQNSQQFSELDPAGQWSLLDITGGFGVDTTLLAPNFDAVTMVEQQAELAQIAAHNMVQFGLNHVQVEHATAEQVLDDYTNRGQQVTWIMVDPARRDTAGKRTYAIADCTPNVCALMPSLLQVAHMVLIKLSPMLDWHKAVADIEAAGAAVQDVHIVAVDNECKELLIVAMRPELQRCILDMADNRATCMPSLHIVQLRHGGAGEQSHIRIPLEQCGIEAAGAAYTSDNAGISDTADISDTANSSHTAVRDTCPLPVLDAAAHQELLMIIQQRIQQPIAEQLAAAADTSNEVQLWLYEPHAAMMKSGCFDYITTHYPVMQLADNSHLFIANTLCTDFPGKTYRVQAISTMNKKQVKALLADLKQANIAVRNFPKPVAVLRKQWKLRDGGQTTLLATTLADGTHIVLRLLTQ